jgi:1,4-dihydroxy-2-naphthoate octaprenyltransferase
MLKHWIAAFRFRTLPLALACIGMGSFLAAYYDVFDLTVCLLSLSTTLCLQILSNLANDYGDTIHGADSADREGPKRSVQQGHISQQQMKNAIIVFSALSFINGISLLIVALEFGSIAFYSFLAMGIMAIFAAIAYTNGKRPYGDLGLGDFFVFLFFGVVGVCGTYILHSGHFNMLILFPAISCGLLATGVLNVNNIRDIKSDEKAGKRSIPVRLGRSKAKIYHFSLIATAWISIVVFLWLNDGGNSKYLVLLSLPLFVFHLLRLSRAKTSTEIDPLLKQLALSTLFFVVAFGFGIILA